MTFTTTVPTRPGVFLWRSSHESTPYAVQIISDEDGLLEVQSVGMTGANSPRGQKGEWCRLVPAEEVEKAFFEGFKAFNDTQWPNTKRAGIWNPSRARKVAEGIE